MARVGHVAWRHLLAGFVGLAVLAAGVALASPFLVFGQVPANEGVGFLPPRSPLGPFLVVYSGLLTVFGTAVLVRGWPAIGAPSRRNRLVHLAIGVVLVGAGGVTAVLFDATVLAVLATLVVPAWWLVRTDRAGFAMVLLVAGAGLLASLELVHARLPQAGSARWNTSLKVAVQAWTLAAAGAGSAIVLLVARARDRLAAGAAPPDRDGDATGSALASLRRVTTDPERRRAALTLLVLALVVLASAIFPLATLGVEVVSPLVQGHYAGSIDARDAIERERPAEAAAIRWLDDREGRPTIVEAPGNSYGWTSPAATFTGLPGVIGWNHEAEYRGQAAYDRRVRHADAIFAGNWSDAARFLQRYDVTYVYVGPNERERYGEDLRSFDRPAFRVAFANDVVTIYRIDRAAFGDPTP